MTLDWYITGALVVAAAWLLWKYLSWNHGYWQRLGVPCVEPSVPFGNTKDTLLLKKHSAEDLREVYSKMEGQPFCGFYRVREPMLLLRDAELARAMFVRDFSSFHDNNNHINKDADPIFARNPFFIKGEKWRRLRSQLSPSFTASRLKPIFPLIKEVGDDLVRMLKREGPKSMPDGLNAWDFCMRYTIDVTSSCALGINGGALEDKNSPPVKLFHLLFQPGFKSVISFLMLFMSPRLASLLRVRLMPAELENFLTKVVTQAVKRREHDGDYRNDYLQMLVELKTKGYLDSAGQVLAEKQFFTDLDIVSQVATFLTDGTLTSSSTMTWVLYELALHPDVQQRLRRELREAVNKHGGKLCYDAIQDASYLDMVVSESLRLYSPLAVLERACTAPYPLTTPSGRQITVQPGTPVVIDVYAFHRDPRYFPDPDVFDPERFSAENKDSSSMKAYMPFGMGPRSCIGQRFAVSQVKMGVASVVLAMEIQITQRTTVPVELDPKNILLAPKGGVWLAFQPVEQ